MNSDFFFFFLPGLFLLFLPAPTWAALDFCCSNLIPVCFYKGLLPWGWIELAFLLPFGKKEQAGTNTLMSMWWGLEKAEAKPQVHTRLNGTYYLRFKLLGPSSRGWLPGEVTEMLLRLKTPYIFQIILLLT